MRRKGPLWWIYLGLSVVALSSGPDLGQAQTPAGTQSSFPVEIPHKFGTAVIETRPSRVVSLSFIGHDYLLALGVVPYALRPWYGNHPYGVWPWAQAALGSGQPKLMPGVIDIERIALMEPDLIVGQWSGMTQRDYDLLRQIAPTIAPSIGKGNYEMSWQDMLLTLGRATGTEETAQHVVTSLEQRVEDIRADHPNWQGKTAITVWAGTAGAYGDEDIRGKLLEMLGFRIPHEIRTRSTAKNAYITMPAEDLSAIDADALIWLDSGAGAAHLNQMPLRHTLRAYREGREIYAGLMLSSALSHSSPLSLHYALDELVPLLEVALDGDPRTEVPTSRDAGILPQHNAVQKGRE